MKFICLFNILFASLFLISHVTLADKGKIIFTNSFDKGFEGWGRSSSKQITLSKTGGRRYKQGVKITVQKGAPFILREIKIIGGATYRLRTWVKGENQGGKRATTAIKISYLSKNSKMLQGRYSHTKLSGEAGKKWQPLDLIYKSPRSAVKMRILLRLFGKGTVFFDDIEVSQLSSGNKCTLGVEPAFTNKGKAVRIEALLTLNDLELAKNISKNKVILYRDGSKKSLKITGSKFKAVDKNTWCSYVSFKPSQIGKYTVSVEFADKSKVESSFYVVDSADNTKPEKLSKDGTILVNGKGFFPIGLYHVPVKENVYRKLKKQGFNCVQGHATHNLETMRKELDLAERCGMKVDVPLYYGMKVRENIPYSIEKIKMFKNHPAVIIWKFADEPDAHGVHLTDELFDLYNTIRKIDKNILTEITLLHVSKETFYAKLCSVIQVDPYPLPHSPLKMVYNSISNAKAAAPPWKCVIATLQSGWTADLTTQPTYSQARTMVYMSIIGGAKGIFWYSYTDPKWNLSKTPLWKDFKRLNDETAFLGNIAINGQVSNAVKILPASKNILKKVWAYKGKLYVAIVNAGTKTAVVSLKSDRKFTNAKTFNNQEFKNISGTISIQLKADQANLVIIKPE